VSRKPTKAAGPAEPGIWVSRVLPVIEKWALAIALTCLALGAVRIVSTYDKLGLTFDEPQHFACGLEYLSRHVYRYEPQHPPLARVMTAVLPYASGVRTSGNPDRESEGVGLVIHSSNPDRFLACMRAGILPFFWLACAVVFLWARRMLRHAKGAVARVRRKSGVRAWLRGRGDAAASPRRLDAANTTHEP